MKELVQNYKTGELKLEEVPVSALRSGGVLVQNAYSLISAGTERRSISTAQANLMEKARKRPDLVKRVTDNIKREGIVATYKKVRNRLDDIKALGYSSAGVVIESACDEFRAGDRVACAGAGYASHAEIIYVPKNLVVKIPDGVDFDEAAFTTLGSIATQGVRQADVRVGENVVVIGLGLVGLLTVQILKAAGCNVIGLDIDEERFDLARELGCDATYKSDWDSLQSVENFTNGIGADAVIITAATQSNEPVELAINLARKKGTVVIVGLVGMDIPRSPFYEKELDIRISCSYGPGRYDQSYEEKGIDYPVGYVRWTENRNMQAFINLVAAKKINVKKMITHKFPINKATEAYDLILNNKEKFIGVLLEYPQSKAEGSALRNSAPRNVGEQSEQVEKPKSKIQIPDVTPKTSADLRIGFIGAGNFAQSYLLPHVTKFDGATLKGVCTSHGTSAKKVAQKFSFEFCTTNSQDIFEDNSINIVFIATRHKSHGRYVTDALQSGKNVFVEKPLCINHEQLDEIREVYEQNSQRFILQVGFNRRFSPYSTEIKKFFSNRSAPFVVNYRVNAGTIPEDNWLQDPEQGGRIIGEVCHFVDLVQFITDANPVKVYAERIDRDESCSVTLSFEDGSICTVFYLANGDSSLPKERVEFFCGEKTAVLDNWQKLWLYKDGKRKKVKLGSEKGHKEEINAFLNSIQNGLKNPIPFENIYMTTLTTFKIHESLEKGKTVELPISERLANELSS